MFDNIGRKIKTLAKVTCALGIAASILGACVIWGQNSRYNSTIFIGILVLVLGSLGSWIGSFFTYGFGELIENSEILHADNLKIQSLLNSHQNFSEQKKESSTPYNTIETKQAEQSTPVVPTDETYEVESTMGMIVCPVCGKIQEDDKKTCWNCGAKIKVV